MQMTLQCAQLKLQHHHETWGDWRLVRRQEWTYWTAGAANGQAPQIDGEPRRLQAHTRCQHVGLKVNPTLILTNKGQQLYRKIQIERFAETQSTKTCLLIELILMKDIGAFPFRITKSNGTGAFQSTKVYCILQLWLFFSKSLGLLSGYEENTGLSAAIAQMSTVQEKVAYIHNDQVRMKWYAVVYRTTDLAFFGLADCCDLEHYKPK